MYVVSRYRVKHIPQMKTTNNEVKPNNDDDVKEQEKTRRGKEIQLISQVNNIQFVEKKINLKKTRHKEKKIHLSHAAKKSWWFL